MMTRIRILLLVIVSFFCHTVIAQTSYGESQLKATIAQLETRESTPIIKAQLKHFKTALIDLQADDSARLSASQYQKTMDDYPVVSQRLKAKITKYKSKRFPNPNKYPLSKLDQEIAKLRSQQTELKNNQEDHSDELTNIGVRISRFQNDIEKLRKRLSVTQKDSDKLASNNNLDNEQEALRVSLQIKESSLSTRIQMLELEQLSASNRSELAQLNNRLIKLQLEDLTTYLTKLNDLRSSILREETEKTIARSQKVNEASTVSSPFLQEQVRINQDLSAELAIILTANDDVQKKQNGVTEQLEVLERTQTNFKEQVEWLKISSAFGESMRTQVSNLPSEPPLKQLEENIVESRLARFQYQKTLLQLDTLTDDLPILDEVQQSNLLRFIDLRRQLLNQLISSLDNNIYEQAKLKVSYSKMNNILLQIKQQANEHLFWVPNTQPLYNQNITEFFTSLVWLVSLENTLLLPQALFSLPIAVLSIAILFVAALIYARYPLNQFFNAHIIKTAPKLGKVTQDKFVYTLRNLAYSQVDAAILPFILWILASLLISAWQFPFAANVGYALQSTLFLLLQYLFLRNLTRKKGLLHAHLKLDKERIDQLWSYCRRLFCIAWPASFIQVLCFQYPEQSYNSSLGRLAFIIICIAFTRFHYRLYKAKLPLTYKPKNNGKPHIVHHSIWAILILAPAVSAIMALMGYLYTAQILLKQLESSLLMGVFFLLTYYLIRRGMHLQKRRLAFERAKAKRIEILEQRAKELAKGEQGVSQDSHFDNLEEPEIDLDQISAQSLGLLRSLLMLLFVVLNALFWSEVQSAFIFLDTVTLWDVSNNLNGVESIAPITLKSFLLAIVTITLTAMLVRNLSGALELLILQHLDLTPGSGFAITTITKYLTVSIGIVVGFNFLGVDWAKTQWLVAALTVGLGFGLQEIFANFVSGLIILFEKPIRIGDTVTIRDLTGNISKIQTRATTIVDWDRKEIIVPNKAFITEQFINWSLSDSITRVIINVGVEFGSDIELVTKLLRDSAEQISLTLENPGPEVFLIEFGDHSLKFEVRCYAAEMSHRLTITHELNMQISQRFQAHDIRLALPQLDVHVKEPLSISGSGSNQQFSMKKGTLR